jgi:hypothetical protein
MLITTFPNADPGRAYLYVWQGGRWRSQATLADPGGLNADWFGFAAAVSGGTVVIGAPGVASYTGGSYVYVRSGGHWHLRATLADPGRVTGDRFGYAVAASGSRLLVGAFFTQARRGKAYVYQQVNGRWRRTAALTAPHRHAGDQFGQQVSLSGARALVAAPSGGSCGEVFEYVVRRGWREREQVKNTDCQQSAGFGSALSLGGRIAAIGAADINENAGVVFLEEVP